jgi:hypothetical protein
VTGKRDRGTRSVVAQIDARLAEVDRELESVDALMAERRRLLQARRALTGETAAVGGLVRRVTQDEVAAYLGAHPGARAGEIAKALGVTLVTISQHLHRGKDSRFERRPDGWHLRAAAS